jgi:hypothetical protein
VRPGQETPLRRVPEAAKRSPRSNAIRRSGNIRCVRAFRSPR